MVICSCAPGWTGPAIPFSIARIGYGLLVGKTVIGDDQITNKKTNRTVMIAGAGSMSRMSPRPGAPGKLGEIRCPALTGQILSVVPATGHIKLVKSAGHLKFRTDPLRPSLPGDRHMIAHGDDFCHNAQPNFCWRPAAQIQPNRCVNSVQLVLWNAFGS